MSQKEPCEPYVYQPDAAKSVYDKAWTISGPGTDAYIGKRFTKEEAERELKKIMARLAANLIEMCRTCKCGGKLFLVQDNWYCARGCGPTP